MGIGMPGKEYIPQFLKANGVTHVFYQEQMFRGSIKRMEELGIQPIRCHTENSVGYFADGYARISGKPSVCFAQSIGAANLAGSIHEAYLGCSPVICFTGKKEPMLQDRNGYQEADHRFLFEKITKFNSELIDQQQLPFLLRESFRQSTTGKPRPVHVDMPCRGGVRTDESLVFEPFAANPEFSVYPPFRPYPDETQVKKAAEEINSSSRPVIVAGRGAVLSDARNEIVALAEKGDIPVITSPDGKTLIDENHPLWAGICGEYGMDCANQLLAKTDLVIFIGTQTSDQLTHNWQSPPWNVKAIHIDIEASEMGKNYPYTLPVVGDAKISTAKLTDVVNLKKRTEWQDVAGKHKQETLSLYEKLRSSTDAKIRPEALCHILSEVLPDDGVLVADTGYSTIWTGTMVRMKSSQRYLRAAGSLGWAYPASLGVKCGVPGRPVICFTGDGGFYYHLAEMETALRYGINTVTIINNNGVYGQCSPALKSLYADAPQRFIEHVDFVETNFSALAKAMGCFAVQVTRQEDISDAIKSALHADRPAIVEVITSPEAYVTSAWNRS